MEMSKRFARSVVALVVAGSVGVAGAGVAGAQSTGSGMQSGGSGMGSGTATSTVAPTQTIVDIASANPDFSTLVSALSAAGLVSTLNGNGPFTVFAPTNEAFAKIPKAQLDSILADKELLTDILTYHVVPGDVRAKDLKKKQKVATVEGSKVLIKKSKKGATIDQAKIVKTDIVAKNGVVHVIDTVILPPSAR